MRRNFDISWFTAKVSSPEILGTSIVQLFDSVGPQDVFVNKSKSGKVIFEN